MRIKPVVRFYVVCLSIILASCKKEKITDIAPTVPPKISSEITALDLGGIKFTPSGTPIGFNSLAIGREIQGKSPELRLSSSGWTHPSILFFENIWSGYNYWASLTPYPHTDSQYENPHIFCSNDGITWIEPRGIFNPIEPCPRDIGFNSDVNLMFENNMLYCYWRATLADTRAIYVRKSADGIHWGSKELVCKMPYGVVDVISPSFIKDADQYYCYAVCGVENQAGNYFNKYSIRRMISSDPLKFNPEKDNGFDLIKIAGRPWGETQEPWHLEVKKLNKFWMLLITTTNFNGYGNGGRLFFGYSTDGINFTFKHKAICSFPGSTYKSSFNPKFDLAQKRVNIEMWRSMMDFDWAVFHDNFSIAAM